jgi:hypothetical protein
MDAFPQGPGGAQQKIKSYWNRPGGKFGILLALAGLGFVGYALLPTLTAIVWNTINFGIACGVAAFFLFLVTNRKLRMTVGYLYEILMRKLVGVVIELDPFVIADDDIADMEKQREMLYKQSIDVEAQKIGIEQKITDKEKEFTHLKAKAEVARQQNMLPELGNATRQLERLRYYIGQLTPIKDSLAKISDYLTKVYKNSGYLVEDAKNELALKKDLYKSVTSGNRALNSALKIFKGDPEKKLMVEQSMEFLKDDIAAKLANMKKAISYSSDCMKSIDLDNATFEQEGLKMLEQFNPDTDFRLSTPDGATDQPKQKVAVGRKIGTVDTQYYDDLLNK